MPLYIIHGERPMRFESELNLREHYTNTFAGVLIARNNLLAMQAARAQFQNHPDRLFFKATAFNRANDVYKKLANEQYAEIIAEYHKQTYGF